MLRRRRDAACPVYPQAGPWPVERCELVEQKSRLGACLCITGEIVHIPALRQLESGGVDEVWTGFRTPTDRRGGIALK